MIHTADLQRSKRLKELGWEQSSYTYWVDYGNGEFGLNGRLVAYNPVAAPTAGEMIEWLLGKGCLIDFAQDFLSIQLGKEFFHALIEDGNICNALANACAWVLERKL